MKSPLRHARPVQLDPVTLTEDLQRTFASPSYRPPTLPDVAMEVMELTSRADVKLLELAVLLQRDPVLAARVLSISQSAAYALRSPPVTLQQAVVRLGLETLREIVVVAALSERVFQVSGHEPFVGRLALHSTATAHVLRLLLRQLRIEAAHGFMCGLLHDIGFGAGLLAAMERVEWRRLPAQQLERVLDAVHVDASGIVARLWKLPEPIQQVLASHHEIAVDGKPLPLNAALIVAEQLCWEAGAGMLPAPDYVDPTWRETPDPPLEGLDVNWPDKVSEARALLHIDEGALATARERAFAVVASLSGGSGGLAA